MTLEFQRLNYCQTVIFKRFNSHLVLVLNFTSVVYSFIYKGILSFYSLNLCTYIYILHFRIFLRSNYVIDLSNLIILHLHPDKRSFSNNNLLQILKLLQKREHSMGIRFGSESIKKIRYKMYSNDTNMFSMSHVKVIDMV